MNEKNENKTTKTTNAKLKLTGFQRMCIGHTLGVDYQYEDYANRDGLTADQCRDAQDWLLDRVAMYFPYGAEEKWKPITITIPDDILESVVFVLDNAVDASTMLEDGYMYGSEYNVPEALADSIIARTKDLIEEQIEALRAVIP